MLGPFDGGKLFLLFCRDKVKNSYPTGLNEVGLSDSMSTVSNADGTFSVIISDGIPDEGNSIHPIPDMTEKPFRSLIPSVLLNQIGCVGNSDGNTLRKTEVNSSLNFSEGAPRLGPEVDKNSLPTGPGKGRHKMTVLKGAGETGRPMLNIDRRRMCILRTPMG